MKFIGIINDIPNGYTYKTAFVNTRELARSLAKDFVNRKNIDYATIDVVEVNVM